MEAIEFFKEKIRDTYDYIEHCRQEIDDYKRSVNASNGHVNMVNIIRMKGLIDTYKKEVGYYKSAIKALEPKMETA